MWFSSDGSAVESEKICSAGHKIMESTNFPNSFFFIMQWGVGGKGTWFPSTGTVVMLEDTTKEATSFAREYDVTELVDCSEKVMIPHTQSRQILSPN